MVERRREKNPKLFVRGEIGIPVFDRTLKKIEKRLDLSYLI
jgi:hypothetical protein